MIFNSNRLFHSDVVEMSIASAVLDLLAPLSQSLEIKKKYTHISNKNWKSNGSSRIVIYFRQMFEMQDFL